MNVAGYGVNGFISLISGLIILAVLGGIALLVCVAISSRAGISISQVTDLSNITDVQGKAGQFTTMIAGLRDVFSRMFDELKSRNDMFSKILSAKGMSIICFFLMLFFGIIPLKFTWGFARVDFNVLWVLQIALLIVFAAVFADKNFQLLIVPIGTYFLLVFGKLPWMMFQIARYSGGYAFGYALREYLSIGGIVLILTLLAIIGVFFLTFIMNRTQDTKIFVTICLLAIPVNYLAICISYGSFFRNILLLVDFSLWTFIMFLLGLVCLTLSRKPKIQ